MSLNTFPKTRAFVWKKDRLMLLDQRVLPHRLLWKPCSTWAHVAKGIRDMVVRGAPAIGCVAAYGLVLAARARKFRSREDQQKVLEHAFDGLLEARPTAVNLRWALERMRQVWARMERRAPGLGNDPRALLKALEKEAVTIEVPVSSGNAICTAR